MRKSLNYTNDEIMTKEGRIFGEKQGPKTDGSGSVTSQKFAIGVSRKVLILHTIILTKYVGKSMQWEPNLSWDLPNIKSLPHIT